MADNALSWNKNRNKKTVSLKPNKTSPKNNKWLFSLNTRNVSRKKGKLKKEAIKQLIQNYQQRIYFFGNMSQNNKILWWNILADAFWMLSFEGPQNK